MFFFGSYCFLLAKVRARAPSKQETIRTKEEQTSGTRSVPDVCSSLDLIVTRALV